MKKKISGGKKRSALRDKRRFRGGRSFPIPLWNGILEHRKKIGSAFWEFAWCLDRITREENGIGFVNGGAPVKAKTIARDFNKVGDKALDEDTVRVNLKKLQEEGYLRLRRTPYGQVIEVMNSLKFGIWTPCERTREKPDSPVRESGKTPVPESGKTPETKKTQQTTLSKKERKTPASRGGVSSFQELLKKLEAIYKKDRGITPTWMKKDYSALKRLREQPHVTDQEIERRFGHYLEGGDAFCKRNGFSLGLFCSSRFDAFDKQPPRMPVAEPYDY